MTVGAVIPRFEGPRNLDGNQIPRFARDGIPDSYGNATSFKLNGIVTTDFGVRR